MNLLVTIDNEEHAKRLMHQIKRLEHVTDVEIVQEDMFNIAAERMEEYKKIRIQPFHLRH